MSRDAVRRTLIAYDIADDKRPDRLAKVLQRHGDRVQYSVFVVDSSGARLRRLKDEIAELVVKSADSVLFCDLGPLAAIDESRFAFLGRERPTTGDIVVL